MMRRHSDGIDKGHHSLPTGYYVERDVHGDGTYRGGLMRIRRTIAGAVAAVCLQGTSQAAPPAIPHLAEWEKFMLDNKAMVEEQPEHADFEKMKEQKQESNIWYYDG